MERRIFLPKVSIILTSYNHEKYIAAAIESALNQTFSDFELLIFDDGSTDNSHEIIKSFKDSRIKLFLNTENIGAVPMFQGAIKISTGEYIALHHSDDIWELDKLEKQVQFLENNPEYEACFTQAKFIDEDGENYNLPNDHHYKNVFKQKNRSREEWLNYFFWKSNCLCHPSILARNHPEYFIHNSSLFHLPDFFTWINLLLKKNIYVLEDELIQFRLRRKSSNSVSSFSLEKIVRVNNEEYFAIKEFLPILNDKEFFLKVFPEAKKFLVDGEINTKFAFAKMCLEKISPSYQKLAIELLYDSIHNDSTRIQIKKLYNYDENAFFKDTGNFDPYGMKLRFNFMQARLYIDFGINFNENDVIDNATLLRAEDGINSNFSVAFSFKTDKEIKNLRFDPDNRALLAIRINKFTVNGEDIKNFAANAIQVSDGYFYFLTDDPYFVLNRSFPAGEINVEIEGTVKTSIPPIFKNFEDLILNRNNENPKTRKFKLNFLNQILKTR